MVWADELQKRLGKPTGGPTPQRKRFDEALELAHLILEQADHPDKPDKTISTTDPDARTGKHGDFFEGYKLDLSMDADSEIITSMATYAANVDEFASNIPRLNASLPKSFATITAGEPATTGIGV